MCLQGFGDKICITITRVVIKYIETNWVFKSNVRRMCIYMCIYIYAFIKVSTETTGIVYIFQTLQSKKLKHKSHTSHSGTRLSGLRRAENRNLTKFLLTRPRTLKTTIGVNTGPIRAYKDMQGQDLSLTPPDPPPTPRHLKCLCRFSK